MIIAIVFNCRTTIGCPMPVCSVLSGEVIPMACDESNGCKTVFGNPKRLMWNIEYNIKRHTKKTGCPATTGTYSPFWGTATCDVCGVKIP